jgi:hypothetical protein
MKARLSNLPLRARKQGADDEMKNLIICVLALGGLCVGLGVVQSDDVDRALQQLRQGLADLGMRVSHLEHAGGSTAPAPAAGSVSAAAVPARTMIIVSVSQSDHADDNSDEIASLKRQHASLMNTVNAAADQADEDLGQQVYAAGGGAAERGWGQAAGGRYVTTNVGSIGRQVIGDKEMENRYATQAANKKEELDRLQAAAAQPKQIILGHDKDGKTVFTLETKFNMNSSLNSIAPGDTVTWTGTRQSADSGGETWFIDSIKKVR